LPSVKRRRLLSAGIRNAEWWTYLSTLRARLAFRSTRIGAATRAICPIGRAGSTPTKTLLEALRAIRAGLDNSPHDPARRRQLAGVWNLLGQCFGSHVKDDAKHHWHHQNARAGLRNYLRFSESPVARVRERPRHRLTDRRRITALRPQS
jgi:hypothetical protein